MTPRPSLWERARRGWLLSEPELDLDEVLDLEYPRCLVKRCPELAARKEILRAALETEIDVDDEFARLVVGDDGGLPGTWMIDREAYRAWRAQCPPELLYGLSHFKKWLGDPPAKPPSPAQEQAPSPDVSQAGQTMRKAQPGVAARDRQCLELVTRATECWRKGDQRNHRAMCDALLPEYEGLPRARVLKELKEALKKLGKPELIYDKAKK